MARGASGARRMEINRAAFDEIDIAMADGMFELAKAVILAAHPPDADPLGLGLVNRAGVVAYVARKRVGVMTLGGDTKLSKPRGAKLNRVGITVIAGFGFPARFNEEGTVHMPGRPFLTPALMGTAPEQAAAALQAAAKRHALGRK